MERSLWRGYSITYLLLSLLFLSLLPSLPTTVAAAGGGEGGRRERGDTTTTTIPRGTGKSSSSNEKEGYFYIYDWPDYLHDVWPPANATLSQKSSYSHAFRGWRGAGQPLNLSQGYFSTWQFALYHLTMARLKASPYRTLRPEEAQTFIIPFDLGVHSYLDHRNGHSRVASPHGWRAIEWLKASIQDSKRSHGVNGGVWKHGGHDHFVLFSLTSYQIIGIGAKIFLTTICQNCSVLTIETTPTNTCRKYYANKSRKWWYAVPYPSSFHWHEGIVDLPWRQRRGRVDGQEVILPRRFLAIFIGSVDTSTPRSNIVRRLTRQHCQVHPQCLWFDTIHSCSGALNVTDGMALYRETTFCLAPPGDSLTRKSLFDSLLAGCIPVIFAKATMNQYIWHIPSEVMEEISVYIPAYEVVENRVNFLSILEEIPFDRIQAMQKKIEEIAPRLQYSIVPEGYGANAEEAKRLSLLDRYGYGYQPSPSSVDLNQTIPYRGAVWSPPFEDAVDVMIHRIFLNRSAIEPMQGFTPREVLYYAQVRDNMTLADRDYAGFLGGKQGKKGLARAKLMGQ